MGYAYELNICKFDLELYKLVGVNFMTISHVLIIFLNPFKTYFPFAFFEQTCLITFYYKWKLESKFQKWGNDHFGLLTVRPNRSLHISLKLLLALFFTCSFYSLIVD